MGQVVAKVIQTGPIFNGFSQAQLSRYEAGRVQFPDPAVLWRLARLYGNVTVQELVDLLAIERQEWATTHDDATESPPKALREPRPGKVRRASS